MTDTANQQLYEHLGYTVSDDRYAFAHPDSPPPVVLVKVTAS